MKFIWILVAVVTINVTKAKSLIDTDLKQDIIEIDVAKLSNPSSYAMARKRSISLFPKMLHREKNFVINLNPKMKTVRQTKLEKYRIPFMKKLLIKNINNKDRVTAEVTTRRSLMRRNNFSVRPHDVYARKNHKKYNWDSNTSTHNVGKSKSEANITKRKFQSSSEKEEINNFNSDDMSLNDHDYVDLEKEHINYTTHTHGDIGLGKSETLFLLSPRNISNYLNVSNYLNAIPSDSENITASNVNDENSNVKIIEDKANINIFPKVIIKSDSRNLSDKQKKNIFDKEEKDQEEYIYVKEINQKAVSNAKRDVSSNGAMTNRERFRFYSFMRNKTS